jgi:hypothetical protein
MTRIALQLLLALALILQGSVSAFGAVRSHAMHGPCCPQGSAASFDIGTQQVPGCPCPSKQHCSSDCYLMCAAGHAALPAHVLSAALMLANASPLVLDSRSLLPRSDAPPIRPPIV